jgi:predicted TIM-barrel fold metal-dependent hydrolase
MIIDSFGAIPDRAILGSWFTAFHRFAGYRRMFQRQFAAQAQSSLDAFDQAPTIEQTLDALSGMFLPIDDYVAVLDALAIEKMGVWVHVDDNSPNPSSAGERQSPVALERLGEINAMHPGRFLPLPSYDAALSDIPSRIVADHRRIGLAGVCVLPICDDRQADDPANDALYDVCTQLGIPVWIHSVNTWSERHPSDYSHPRFADRVACRFPGLKIVLGHGGWPWVNEAVAIAWRHLNVYLEPSAFRWKHLAAAGSGWEPLMLYGNTTIADKVLFGSLWPNLGMPLAQVLEEVQTLPLKPKTLRQWTYDNARRLYGS